MIAPQGTSRSSASNQLWLRRPTRAVPENRGTLRCTAPQPHEGGLARSHLGDPVASSLDGGSARGADENWIGVPAPRRGLGTRLHRGSRDIACASASPRANAHPTMDVASLLTTAVSCREQRASVLACLAVVLQQAELLQRRRIATHGRRAQSDDPQHVESARRLDPSPGYTIRTCIPRWNVRASPTI